MKVIILSGKSGSGKDAVASLFKNKLLQQQKRVLTIHFADLVKYYAALYYNWDGEKNETGRSLLQKIGTTMMRTYEADYWAAIVAKFIDAAADDFDVALIPDWRFINEYETVCDYNPYVYSIRIERYNLDGTPYVNPDMTPEQLAHISETELDQFAFDYILENREGLEALADSVDVIIEDIDKE